MKRSRLRARCSRRCARRAARIAWCMVGTAVYQVGCASSSQAKKRSALKPGRAEDRGRRRPARTSIAAIRPWMWNSGMMLRQRSSGVSAERGADVPGRGREVARGSSGTIFGREVVPEVCRTSATSSGAGVAAAGGRGRRPRPRGAARSCRPARPCGTRRSQHRDAEPARPPRRAGPRPRPRATISALAPQVGEVELELLLPVGRD